jgi:hypothetical protein
VQPIPQAVQHCHELLLWIIPHIDKFPRVRRFTLGERLETRLLEVLENLVEAAYTKNKKTPLTVANRQLEIVRHLWRLSFELHVISSQTYEHGAKLTNELGKQVGGWLKTMESRIENA